eukprot:7599963-Alexandrium_andersonii.AAC.1
MLTVAWRNRVSHVPSGQVSSFAARQPITFRERPGWLCIFMWPVEGPTWGAGAQLDGRVWSSA